MQTTTAAAKTKSVKDTLKSTWTPLNKDDANLAMFEERRNLLLKWFAKWTPDQRKTIMDDLLGMSSPQLVEHTYEAAKPKVPVYKVDFTRVLPRSLSLLLFSYLDPRSLCRATQVNWYWNWLCDSDEVWLPKCARLGWHLPAQAHRDVESFTFWTGKAITPGVYKRLYLENLTSLQVEGPSLKEMQRLQETSRRQEEAKARKAKARREAEQAKKRVLSGAVWRAPDKHPVDTMRYNYLDSRDIEIMESRKKEPQPHNTMRSVVLTGNGKLPLQLMTQQSAATTKDLTNEAAKRHAVNIRALHQRILSDSAARANPRDHQASSAPKSLPAGSAGEAKKASNAAAKSVGVGGDGEILVETFLDGQLTQSKPWGMVGNSELDDY